MQTFRFPDVTASILSINFTDEICGSVCGGGGGSCFDDKIISQHL